MVALVGVVQPVGNLQQIRQAMVALVVVVQQ
jgi:hypothetical protein